MKHPPKLVCSLAYGHDAWVVGSAANRGQDLEPRDYDVVVPYSEWHKASHLIPRDAIPNSFGGWKCICEGVEIDVWPADLGLLMTYTAVKYLWHPKTDAYFERGK